MSFKRFRMMMVLAAVLVPAGTADAASRITLKMHPIIPTATLKVCFWKENNGTLFGISGKCPIGQQSVVGSPCTCTRTVEHNVTSHDGTVIEIPAPSAEVTPIH